jgi:hypothetical protein
MVLRQDERVTDPTLLGAVEELYANPTAEFTARRKTLSVAARSGGDRELAARIAALRKPTLAADTLNRLVRTAPEAMQELLDLGTDLRAAEKALDAVALRELSTTRRGLVNDLTQLAFDITEQRAPSGSTRDEVLGTLNAALADQQVADRLMSGALVTQARWDGFGSTSLPELAAVIPMPAPRAAPSPATGQGIAVSAPVPAQPALREPAQRRLPRVEQANEQAATGQRDLEKQRLLRLEAARKEAEEAEQAASAAAQDLADIDRRIGELSLQIAHQRDLLAGAQRKARATESRRRAAQLTLTRSGGSASQ